MQIFQKNFLPNAFLSEIVPELFMATDLIFKVNPTEVNPKAFHSF